MFIAALVFACPFTLTFSTTEMFFRIFHTMRINIYRFAALIAMDFNLAAIPSRMLLATMFFE
jgi:hypothetical protein